MKHRLCPQCGLIHDPWRCILGAAPQEDATVSAIPKPPRNPEIDAIVNRLNAYLASVPQQYPTVWKQVDVLRAERGKAIPDWPRWCFMPLVGAYAIASEGRDDVFPTGSDVGTIGALAAWRVTKGIYRFDATVFDELWETPIEGNIPVEVLQKLPEWCCYIPFPEPKSMLGFGACRGFFVHLEFDQKNARTELRFLLDDNNPPHLTAMMLHLVGNLSDCVANTVDEVERQAKAHWEHTGYTSAESGETIPYDDPKVQEVLLQVRQSWPVAIQPLLSIVLYLCSTTAEIVPRNGYRPKLRHTKRNTKLFAAEQIVVWDVAYRLGKTLREAQERKQPSPDQDGSHASPRPHIRRSHWHSFWTGEKAKSLGQTTKRELILKWLPPIPVNVKDGAETIPTIHRVTK